MSTMPDWCQAMNVRIDEAKLASGEITGEPRQRAREHERAELVSEDRKADGTHTLFIGPDTGQRAAQRRVQYVIEKYIDRDQHDQHEVIKLRGVFQIERLETP